MRHVRGRLWLCFRTCGVIRSCDLQFTPSLSANGTTNGIIWDIDNSAYNSTDPSASGPSVLHAYDASNVANELYNSVPRPAAAIRLVSRLSSPARLSQTEGYSFPQPPSWIFTDCWDDNLLQIAAAHTNLEIDLPSKKIKK